MKCLTCGGVVPPKINNVGGNKKLYCSTLCRNKAYYKKKGGAEAQREYIDKIRQKDNRGKIKCEICGKYYRQVGSHVWGTHRITAREYREAYGFDVKRGQLPEDYRKLKAEQAIECGGVKNLKLGKKFWFKKGDPRVGRYTRSKQTLERLKHNGKNRFVKIQTA